MHTLPNIFSCSTCHQTNPPIWTSTILFIYLLDVATLADLMSLRKKDNVNKVCLCDERNGVKETPKLRVPKQLTWQVPTKGPSIVIGSNDILNTKIESEMLRISIKFD